MTQLVLSIFPGIDLLGRGFESEGFCVVRGPDLIYGGDIREFHPVTDRFDGIIGGPPCQDFSKARRSEPTGYGLEMLSEFTRCVTEAQPLWFLIENVPTVPTVQVEGYAIQRFDLNASECGLSQNRPRHFQFGHRLGWIIIIEYGAKSHNVERCCVASEGNKSGRRTWSRFCELQGLPATFYLPGWSRSAKYAAVGNGVPIPMGRVIARAVTAARAPVGFRICDCGCGRPVAGKQMTATVACRKRLQRKRDLATVTIPGAVTLFDACDSATGESL